LPAQNLPRHFDRRKCCQLSSINDGRSSVYHPRRTRVYNKMGVRVRPKPTSPSPHHESANVRHCPVPQCQQLRIRPPWSSPAFSVNATTRRVAVATSPSRQCWLSKQVPAAAAADLSVWRSHVDSLEKPAHHESPYPLSH